MAPPAGQVRRLAQARGAAQETLRARHSRPEDQDGSVAASVAAAWLPILTVPFDRILMCSSPGMEMSYRKLVVASTASSACCGESPEILPLRMVRSAAAGVAGATNMRRRPVSRANH